MSWMGTGFVVPLPRVTCTTTCIHRGLMPRQAKTGIFYWLVFGRMSYLKANSSERRCGMKLLFVAALASLRSKVGLPWNYTHAKTGTRHNNKHIWTCGASGISLGAGWNCNCRCGRLKSAVPYLRMQQYTIACKHICWWIRMRERFSG